MYNMIKKLQKNTVTLAATLVKHVKLNTIVPFTEKPSVQAEPSSEASENSDPIFSATDLFSLFTADIIKKEVLFTR